MTQPRCQASLHASPDGLSRFTALRPREGRTVLRAARHVAARLAARGARPEAVPRDFDVTVVASTWLTDHRVPTEQWHPLLSGIRAIHPVLPDLLARVEAMPESIFWAWCKLDYWHTVARLSALAAVEAPLLADLAVALPRYDAIAATAPISHLATLRARVCTEPLAARPLWWQELIIHLLGTAEDAPGDLPVLVTAARLAQGLSQREALRDGFRLDDVENFEQGVPVATAARLQVQTQKYRLDLPVLGEAYARHHGTRVAWNRLRIAKPAWYVSPTDIELLGVLAGESPSTGEYLLNARLTAGESVIDRTRAWGLTGMQYRNLEWNVVYPEWCHVERFPPEERDELLRLILWTWFPQLRDTQRGYPYFIHPRLTTEPIYLTSEDRQLPAMIQAYAAQPGTLGEELCWRRLRRGQSLRSVVRGSKLRPQRLRLIERNLIPPRRTTKRGEDDLAHLARVLAIDEGELAARVDRMSWPEVDISWTEKYIRTDGHVAWDRITPYPSPPLLRVLTQLDGITVVEAAQRLNARFYPDLPIEQLPGYPGHAVPLAADDVARLRLYQAIGRLTIAERLTWWRLAAPRHWTIAEAAAALGIEARRLSKLERFVYLPTAEELPRLAATCGWDLPELTAMAAAERAYRAGPRPHGPAIG